MRRSCGHTRALKDGRRWSRSASASTPRRVRLDQSVVGPGVPLTDAQWSRIEPLLPDRTPKWAGRWRGHREVIDAIAFKFQTGTQWVHLPEKYGNWRVIHNRLRMWAVDGTWERVFTALVAQADADEDVSWAVVRGLHDRARSPARCRSPQKGAPAEEPGHHAVGRSRGGLTTTIHFAADGHCRPLVFVLGPGQAEAHRPSRMSWPVCAFPALWDGPAPGRT
ncbi:IS5 family transposase [Streptomyces sp. MBT27]|uniref:IS5 family transposase n=1 Tax=Streptomyces sp. MBT27 TaxID=1488356 RepID=UPI001F071788|nr:IS5 family transposase [Streptomyces sp. MBT27]